MNTSLRLGAVLPPVPAGVGRGDLAAWWRAAAAVASAGAGSIWLVGDPLGAVGPGADGGSCDPCTLAAGFAPRVHDVLLGVVSSLPAGRHPSVLARDVTALDVVSGGRAAVQVRWDAPPPVDVGVACEHLSDAVAVCAAMLRGGVPAYDGAHFHISGAANRPGPVQAGGPPVVVGSPPALAGALADAGTRREAAVGRARAMAVLADAVVCAAEPAEVAAWRAVLDGSVLDGSVLDGSVGTGRATGRHPGLLCLAAAGGLEDGAGDAAQRAVASAAGRCRDAGADGIVLELPPALVMPRPGDGPRASTDAGVPAADLRPLAALATAAYAPWSGGAS